MGVPLTNSIPRIVRVRLKAGGSDVRVLHNDEPRKVAAHVRRSTESSMAAMPKLAGFAYVMWGSDGSTSATYQNYPGSPIGQAMIPDFARTCLADVMTYRGVMDDVKG